MLLGDFIKELKHNSLNIKLEDGDGIIFYGTIGTLKNNIHYQNEWNRRRIFIIDAQYDKDMKTSLEIDLC